MTVSDHSAPEALWNPLPPGPSPSARSGSPCLTHSRLLLWGKRSLPPWARPQFSTRFPSPPKRRSTCWRHSRPMPIFPFQPELLPFPTPRNQTTQRSQTSFEPQIMLRASSLLPSKYPSVFSTQRCLLISSEPSVCPLLRETLLRSLPLTLLLAPSQFPVLVRLVLVLVSSTVSRPGKIPAHME